MLRALLFALALALTGCGTLSVNAGAQRAYKTIDAYVLLIENRVDRGRISKTAAQGAINDAKKARDTVAEAYVALAACKAPPCDGTALLTSVQPLLLEYERQLSMEQKP